MPPEDLAVSLLGHEVSELLAAGDGCLAGGDAENAVVLYRAAAMRKPWDPEARYRLAGAQIAFGKLDEAALTLTEAREQHARLVIQASAPEYASPTADAQTLLKGADLFYASNQMAAATCLLQRLVESNPNNASLRLKLGLALQHQGRIAESIAAFEAVERRWPSPGHHSFLHYARAFERATPEAMYEEGLRYAERHIADLPKATRALVRRGGKLRIGYFSPLFNSHQLTKFFLPVMENHDRERFSIVCYSGTPARDAVGEAIQAGADIWRDVGGLNDGAFAAQVAADEIDIFVDLWGHTAGNRLPVFGRTPAPIQVSWLNYIETTGMADFSYVLHADGYDLPGAQGLFAETIYPVGPVVAPFRPFHDSPPAGPTPMLANGFATFGCFGHPAKLTLEVIRIWSAILVAVPDAKLVLRSGYLQDPVLQRSIRAQFAAFGVAADRIEIPPFAQGAEFLATYKTVDLVLEPFPYQGFTTGLDTVCAGVPMLTLEGQQLTDRIGAVTLRACGLEDLIAPSAQAYVELAIALAQDPQRLNALRAQVRPGFEASPYRDEEGFTRRLEVAFEDMAAKHQAQERAA